MKIVYKAPDEFPKVMDVENELDDLQYLVGGNIEYVEFDKDLAFVVNEDGEVLGLAPNVYSPNWQLLKGPVLVVAFGSENLRSMTDYEIRFAREYLEEMEVME